MTSPTRMFFCAGRDCPASTSVTTTPCDLVVEPITAARFAGDRRKRHAEIGHRGRARCRISACSYQESALATFCSSSTSRWTVTGKRSLLAVAHDFDVHASCRSARPRPCAAARGNRPPACRRRSRRHRRSACRPSAPDPIVHARNQRAASLVETEAFGELIGHLLDAHAEPAAPNDAACTCNWAMTFFAALIGMAKPMPTEPPVGE